MKSTGRILVLEDEERWREIFGSALRTADYQVDIASSVAEARDFLNHNFYHLAVIDVSMVFGDGSNREGLDFVGELERTEHGEGLKVILISAYMEKTRVREAFKKFKVADFQDKYDFDEANFLTDVRKVVEDSINLNLEVQWESRGQRDQVVLNLEVEGERVKRDTPLQARVADELEDLLCRLFPEAQSLLVRPLTAGLSGSAVLRATPFLNEGAATPVVVKFGAVKRIKREYENFKKYAEPFIRARSTNIIKLNQTTHLAGITYSLLGSRGDDIKSFREFYPRHDLAQIQETLTRLFSETCAAWYANHSPLRLCNLTNEYCQKLELTEEKLQIAFSQLKGVQGKGQLYFDSIKGRGFTNPLIASADREFQRSTYVCYTHGDLNSDNILVDESNEAWLIDFEYTGPGHILRDIAEMDLVVRAELLGAEEASLSERLELEEALFKARSFKDLESLRDSFDTQNPALAKAYATVLHLRTIAADMVSKNPSADFEEYYIGLFYYSLNALRFLSWRAVARQHCLLSACLIADKLGL
ncbi:MAG TPA: response regulator [Pyrinomonadaceae bacterium]|nr:response regulator [Pyrinomonadaceae bacterium]